MKILVLLGILVSIANSDASTLTLQFKDKKWDRTNKMEFSCADEPCSIYKMAVYSGHSDPWTFEVSKQKIESLKIKLKNYTPLTKEFYEYGFDLHGIDFNYFTMFFQMGYYVPLAPLTGCVLGAGVEMCILIPFGLAAGVITFPLGIALDLVKGAATYGAETLVTPFTLLGGVTKFNRVKKKLVKLKELKKDKTIRMTSKRGYFDIRDQLRGF